MYRFHTYAFDARTGELRGPGGVRRLQPQPARLLVLLLDADGRLVERDEVRTVLWPDITVDFDSSLNTCVRQIRMALAATGDGLDTLETLRKRGYRLTVPVHRPEPLPRPRPRQVGRTRALLAGAAVLGLVVAFAGWRAAKPSPETTSVSAREDARRPVRLAIVPFIDPQSDANAAFNRDLTEAFVVAMTDVAATDLAVVGPSTTSAFYSGADTLASVAEAVGADFVLHGGHRSQSDVFFVEVVRADGGHLYAQRMPLDLSAKAEAPADVVSAMMRSLLAADGRRFHDDDTDR